MLIFGAPRKFAIIYFGCLYSNGSLDRPTHFILDRLVDLSNGGVASE